MQTWSKNNKSLLCLTVLCSLISTILAQHGEQLKNQRFERLNIESGLSSNMIFDVLQDKQGFYWISSVNGLNRFDGTIVRTYHHDKNDSQTISHDVCNLLVEGNDGDIWIATAKGVSRFSKKTGKFTRYLFHHLNTNDDILNRINGLVKDKHGNIWVASYGLWKIDPKSNSIMGYFFGDRGSSLPEQAHSLLYSRTLHGCWFTSKSGLFFLDIESGTFHNKSNHSLNWSVFSIQVNNPLISINTKDDLWLYDEQSKKLYQFDPASKKLSSKELSFPNEVSNMMPDGDNRLLFGFDVYPTVFLDPSTFNKDSMPERIGGDNGSASRIISKTYIDSDSNKWYCSTNGAFIARKKSQHTKVFLLEPDRLGYQHPIWSIAAQTNKYWLGTKNGLFEFDQTTNRLARFPGEDFEKDIRTLYKSGDSVLWVSSRTVLTLLRIGDRKVIKKIELPSYIYFITADKWGHHWVGTFAKGLFEFDAKGNLLASYSEKQGMGSPNLISCFNEGDTVLWIGLNGGKGFDRFSIETKKSTNFLIKTQNNSPDEFNTVNAITTDHEKNLWLGTYGGGVYFFDRKSNQFKNFRQTDGLSGDFINTLATDSQGNLWISGFYGTDVMDIRSNEIFKVNEKMQYDNLDFINSFLLSDNGEFVFTSNGKIVVINPEVYLKQEQEAKIIVSNLKIHNREVQGLDLHQKLKLSYDQNYLNIEFSVLKVSPSIPAQFSYRLDGLQKDWSYSNGRGIANYTNIPPGSYKFLFNASNEHGRWNKEPLSITIEISPPFWKTIWFYGFCFLLTSATLFWAIRQRLARIRAQQQTQLRLVVATQEREKKIISGELHDDLGVRLSALKYFVTSLKPYLQFNNKQAEDTYQKTITTIDESVEDIRYLLINLSPKTLNEYGYLVAVEDLVNKITRLHILEIELTQKGLEKRLDAETEASLYRITQELINNTLKHAGATRVTLSIERTSGHIKLEYTDNGKGFDSHGVYSGYGLENINTRIKLLNGKIEWESGNGKFTRVIMQIPYNHPLV